MFFSLHFSSLSCLVLVVLIFLSIISLLVFSLQDLTYIYILFCCCCLFDFHCWLFFYMNIPAIESLLFMLFSFSLFHTFSQPVMECVRGCLDRQSFPQLPGKKKLSSPARRGLADFVSLIDFLKNASQTSSPLQLIRFLFFLSFFSFSLLRTYFGFRRRMFSFVCWESLILTIFTS